MDENVQRPGLVVRFLGFCFVDLVLIWLCELIVKVAVYYDYDENWDCLIAYVLHVIWHLQSKLLFGLKNGELYGGDICWSLYMESRILFTLCSISCFVFVLGVLCLIWWKRFGALVVMDSCCHLTGTCSSSWLLSAPGP